MCPLALWWPVRVGHMVWGQPLAWVVFLLTAVVLFVQIFYIGGAWRASVVLFLSDFNARFNAADCQREGSRNSHNGSTSAVNTVSFQTIPIFEKYHVCTPDKDYPSQNWRLPEWGVKEAPFSLGVVDLSFDLDHIPVKFLSTYRQLYKNLPKYFCDLLWQFM